MVATRKKPQKPRPTKERRYRLGPRQSIVVDETMVVTVRYPRDKKPPRVKPNCN